MVESINPPVKYTARDWFSLREFMFEAALERVPDWTNRSPNDFGVVMVEMMAYVGDILSFYGDRIANEAFLRTAVQRKSVLDIARMLDYVPAQGNAAKTTLQFTVLPDAGAVTIPKCTQVMTVEDDPVFFEVDEDLVFNASSGVPGSNVGNVAATEGREVSEEQIGISTGAPNQSLYLAQSPIIGGTVEIVVNEGFGDVTWRKVDHLIEINGPSTVYVTEVDEFDTVEIIFGDNVNGKVPLSGSIIKANYRVGGGTRGNVPPTTLVELVNTIPSVISVTNPDAATEGADPESLDDIRRNAPRALTTLERAVSLRDHAYLALRYPGVARASAKPSGSGIPGEVDLIIAPQGGGSAKTTLTTAVKAYVQERSMPNIVLTMYSPTYVPINITLDIEVLPTYSREKVERQVELAMNELLAFGNTDFGMRVTQSAIYSRLREIEGVDYGTISVLSRTATGLGDVATLTYEIPEMGTLVINTTGGVA